MTSDIVVRQEYCLEDIGPATWNALLAHCPDATCFQSYEWISCWWKVFGGDNELLLLSAYRNGMLVGFAPMYLEANTLYFVGEGHSDYNVFVWHEREPQVVDLLLDTIIDTLQIRSVHFYQVPVKSRLGNILRGMHSIRLRRLPDTPCPRLAGEPEYIDGCMGKKSIKRNRSKLGKLGKVSVEHLTDSTDITPHLNAFFQQHIERWSSTEYPSLFNKRENKAFYEELAKTDIPVLFTVISVDKKAVAFHFGFISTGDLVWYKPTFDIHMGSYSPGEVLLSELIEYVRAQQLTGLDFTRGNETFKLRFCSEVNSNLNCEYYHSIPLRLLVKDRLKRMVRRMFPSTRSVTQESGNRPRYRVSLGNSPAEYYQLNDPNIW
jgi:CelD/BcsL family acetyltransferase involved in cellulose biosynthesis